jgi:hypothetical protein
VLDRFETIGLQIMSRSGGGGPFDADPIAGVLGDPSKRTVAAQVIGQAYVTAHNLATLNRQAIERIADALEDKREIMGDELLDLLDSQGIRIPDIDYGDEAVWPPIEFSVAIGRGGPGTAPAALPEPAAPASNGEPSLATSRPRSASSRQSLPAPWVLRRTTGRTAPAAPVTGDASP